MVELDKFFRCPNCQSFSLSKCEPNFKEKIMSLFTESNVYVCSNCSYRYVDRNTPEIKKRLIGLILIITIPVLLFLSVILFSPENTNVKEANKNKKQEKTSVSVKKKGKIINSITKNKNDINKTKLKDIDNKKEEIKDKPKIIVEKSGSESMDGKNPKAVENRKPKEKQLTIKNGKNIDEKIDYKYIYFRNIRKFGVNWSSVENGVKITRISHASVFYKHGIRKNDVLSEFNGIKIINGDKLLVERDRLFEGKIKTIELKVLRGKKILYFSMVRIDDNSYISREILKTRSSHPNSKNRNFRWIYKKKTIIVFRKENQRVYISGDYTGKKTWAVDDTLLINGHEFKGILEGKVYKGRPIEESRKIPPKDITDLIPSGKKFVLKIQLANHGILYGNTDIYIIVR